MITITRKIVFHTGHMLKDDESKCHNPHGHEYHLECTVGGSIQKEGAQAGMVLHFGNLKEIMMEEVHDVFDHKFIVQNTDPRFQNFDNVFNGEGIVVTTKPPTAENLLEIMRMRIGAKLPESVTITSMRLQETVNCWAEYERS